jgi:GNAT superfamily N-acetyltransferase
MAGTVEDTRILLGPTEELAVLVQEFRNALRELDKNATPCSLDEARDEAAEYFEPGHTVVGLYREDSLIGFSVVSLTDGVYWLSWIYVKPENRGFTNASRLFDASEKIALEAGEDRLYVWVHPNNNLMLRFLKKKGYDTLNLIEVTKRERQGSKEVRIFDNILWY